MVQDPVKNFVNAPEGRYQVHSLKGHSCSFNTQRPSRLTYAVVDPTSQQDQPSKLIIFNSSDVLAISHYAAVDKVRPEVHFASLHLPDAICKYVIACQGEKTQNLVTQFEASSP